MMSYNEVTDYLFSQLPMYQRIGAAAFKKDLTNIVALCELLGNPHLDLKMIHVAGTNGKGSVSHMIAAGIQAHGKKVGLYTSPHYKDYRERIKINGVFIPETEVVDFVVKYKNDFDRIQPSFFEITVALAFHHFAKQKVDIAVIETGLGGRLDSTNIIRPLMSVITNISYDHQSMLGDTLTEIAAEKAGIIKQKIPVIVGESQDEVKQVFVSKANNMNAPLGFADEMSSVEVVQDSNGIDELSFWVGDRLWIKHISTHLTNPYQLKNLNTALYSLYCLKDILHLKPQRIAKGIEKINQLTYFIGRWMIVDTEPLIILDSAHNEAGIKYLVHQLRKLSYDSLHIIWGNASDKDVSTIFAILPKEAKYYFAKANIPRGMAAGNVKQKASEYGLSGEVFESVKQAYNTAKENASADDLILVAGSIFVVAEVL